MRFDPSQVTKEDHASWQAAAARARKELERNRRLIDAASPAGTKAGKTSDYKLGGGTARPAKS